MAEKTMPIPVLKNKYGRCPCVLGDVIDLFTNIDDIDVKTFSA